jgi:hypothetical protein
MNKGIKASKGEWLYFLNSDDCLFDNKVFENVVKEFDKSTDVLCGAIAFKNKEGKLQKTFTPFSVFGLKIGKAPPHQGAFFRKKCFKYEGYSLDYKLSADYDFFCYCVEKNFKAKNSPNLIISIFSFGGRGSKKHSFESDKIISERYGYLFLFLKNVFLIFKKIKNLVGAFLLKIGLYKSKNVI